MKITVYTITDCYFCKQEKEYLKSHNLPFEEKNLEENRDFLTEMLTISNNFAGTPVTKLEKDDGTIVILKGFTKEEFDETLGIKSEEVKVEPKTEAPVVAVDPAPAAPPVQVAPAPVAETAPAPVVAAPAPQAAAPATPDVSSITAQIEELKRLQESLMKQSQAMAPATPPVQAAPVPVVEPTPAPVVAAPAPQAAAPVAQPAPNQAAVDDSLAAILAELQAKINSANSSGTQGQSTS
ncbi:MAG: glutaredoxin family protein [Patescibacteria group bacterium]